MLARRIKINTIKQQREYIKAQLEALITSKTCDGKAIYRYVGFLFQEVVKYFKEEGFEVEIVRLKSEKYSGYNIYIFTPNENIKLTPEEIEEAEKYEAKPSNIMMFKKEKFNL